MCGHTHCVDVLCSCASTLASSQGPTQKSGKGPGVTCKLSRMCCYIMQQLRALHDHMVNSYCWRWHYRVDEQILLRSDYRQILWGKSTKRNYVLSFWNSTFTKSLLASFPFSNGLRTSLPLSCVKNSVIANGRTWFLYSKQRLLTQHIRKFLHVTPGPFLILGGAWGRGYIYTVCMSLALNESAALHCFECGNTIQICIRIMLELYPGLPSV